jgi:hypothetical protein
VQIFNLHLLWSSRLKDGKLPTLVSSTQAADARFNKALRGRGL